MPVIPKTQLTMASGAVPRYGTQQMLPKDFNVGNSLGAGIAKGIGSIADAVASIATMKGKEERLKKEADEKLAQANEEFTLREMMLDANARFQASFEDMKRNPGSYGEFREIADDAVGTVRIANDERYQGLSELGKRKYDLFQKEAELGFYQKAENLQYQATVSHMLEKTNHQIQDALSGEEPDFLLARDTVNFQLENGLVTDIGAEEMLKKIGVQEQVHAASLEMQENPKAFLANVAGGKFGELPGKERASLCRDAQGILNAGETRLMDSLSVRMAEGEEISQEELSALHETGTIGDRNYSKLLSMVKEDAERKESAYRKASENERKQAEERKAMEDRVAVSEARRKVYAMRWDEDPIERGRQYNDICADIMERLWVKDRQACSDLLAYLKQTAYPEKAANPMLVRQYEQEFGEGPDASLLSVADPERDGKWWRDSRGNEDEVTQQTGAFFDMAMRKYIDMNPEATIDDLRSYSVSLGKRINAWTIDNYMAKLAEASAKANAKNIPVELRKYDDKEGNRWIFQDGAWGVMK